MPIEWLHEEFKRLVQAWDELMAGLIRCKRCGLS
jgi:hypothetical protein